MWKTLKANEKGSWWVERPVATGASSTCGSLLDRVPMSRGHAESQADAYPVYITKENGAKRYFGG